MKFAAAPLHLETNGLATTSDFTIKASAKAFQILFSNLYSDPALAVIRELLTNAWDAHTRAGNQDTPIEVHIPTAMDSEFRVKDYGTGISHAGVHSLYITVFDSDKTDSNNEIGGLGLGSKSPFSLTDQFHLRSVFMGVARQYTAFVQTDGTPGLADVGPPQSVDEPDGFEVIVPITPKYRTGFDDRYTRFVQTIPTPPVSNCHVAITHPDILVSHTIGEYRVDVLTNGEKLRHEYGAPIVMMGIVPYTITGSQKYHLPEIFRSPNIIIHAPVGSFEINPSRESLSLKPDDFTRFETLAYDFVVALIPHFQSTLREAKNARHASALHRELARSTALYSAYRQACDEGLIHWKGYNLGDDDDINRHHGLLKVPADEIKINHRVVRIDRTGTHKLLRNNGIYNVSHKHNLTPAEILYAEKNKPFRHMLDFDNLKSGQSIWVCTGETAAIKRWLRMYGFWDLARPITKAPKKPRASSTTKRETLGTFAYLCQIYTTANAHTARYTIDELERYKPTKTNILMTGEPPSGALERFLPPECQVVCVNIPDTHKKVQHYFTNNLASYPDWVTFARDHIDIDPALDALNGDSIYNRIRNSATLSSAADLINAWGQWGPWEMPWIHNAPYARTQEYLPPAAALATRLVDFAQKVRRTRSNRFHAGGELHSLLKNALPDLDARQAANLAQWTADMDQIEKDLTALRDTAPALFQNNDRSTPVALINAYLREVNYGQ